MKKKMVSVLLTASMLAGMTMFAVPVMAKMQRRRTKLPETLPQMIPLLYGAGMTISRRFLTDHLKKPIQMITKESYS